MVACEQHFFYARVGTTHRIATIPTVAGGRGVVVDPSGRAYVADPTNGRILKITFQ
jgi:DNA-binding beta-propeller fold protein YncE